LDGMVEKAEQRLRTLPNLLGNHDLDQLHPHTVEKNLVCGQVLSTGVAIETGRRLHAG
jgi:hypothetical protein